MAKASGIGWTTLTVDDSTGSSNTDIKNDITNLQFATPRAVTDVTGIDKFAIERLLLLADFSITLTAQWNTAGVHGVFKTICSSQSVSRTTTLVVNTATLQGGAGPGIETWYTDYQVTRAAGGDLNVSIPGVLADGSIPTWA